MFGQTQRRRMCYGAQTNRPSCSPDVPIIYQRVEGGGAAPCSLELYADCDSSQSCFNGAIVGLITPRTCTESK